MRNNGWPCSHNFTVYPNGEFSRTCALGRNALAAYILHEIVAKAVQAFAPPDSPLWWVVATFAAYVGITYLFIRHLEKNGVYLRL